MDSNKIGRLSAEEVAAAAYSQFGIVADDQEIAAFARWVLEQNGHDKMAPALKAVDALWASDNFCRRPELTKQVRDALTAAGAA